MANVNTVTLSGNLTRDPEYKQISDEFAVCDLGIAVNRSKKGSDGEYTEEVSFFDLKVLGAGFSALVGKKLRKGDSVTLSGRLQQDRWEKDGEKRSKVVVVVDQLDSDGFFRSKDEDASLTSSAPASSSAQTNMANPDAPAAAAPAQDDDIPF
jgi:single-strand DNA-binding protein